MKNVKLELYKGDENDSFPIDLIYDESEEICISINIGYMNLIDILKDKKMFIEYKNFIENIKDILEEDIYLSEEDWEYILNNFERLIDCVEYICFFSETEAIEILKEYPMLKSKKIVIKEIIAISDFDRIEKYENLFGDTELYLMLSGNFRMVSLKDCYATMQEIREKGEFIKSLQLSPFETILFVYDMVRERIYNGESKNDNIAKSRDLTKSVPSDKIVYLGYPILFKRYLDYLGIYSSLKILLDKNTLKPVHTRNHIHIVDEKYGIDGSYYFDATWDSKRFEEDKIYINRFLYFAKTHEEMKMLENNKFIHENEEIYHSNMIEELKRYRESGDIPKACELINNINRIVANIDTPDLIDLGAAISDEFDFEEYSKKFKKYLEQTQKRIPAEVFLAAFDKVRTIEHELDPEKYPYTVKSMIETFFRSKWEFTDKKYYIVDYIIDTFIYGCDDLNGDDQDQKHMKVLINKDEEN